MNYIVDCGGHDAYSSSKWVPLRSCDLVPIGCSTGLRGGDAGGGLHRCGDLLWILPWAFGEERTSLQVN
jgi:hypothetical protein